MTNFGLPDYQPLVRLQQFLDSEQGYTAGFELGKRYASRGVTIPTYEISIRKDRWAHGYRDGLRTVQPTRSNLFVCS